jgi:hypothetical protein
MAKKPAPKPAPKPVAKATAKPVVTPIDNVRNPNFDSAMARQNYANMLEDARARQFAEGRMLGAPSGQGGLGGLTANQAGISEDQRRMIDDLMGKQAARGGIVGMTADQAGIPADQRKILDDLMARDQVNFAANEAKRQDFMKTQKPVGGSIAGPIYGSLAGNVLANGAPANMSPDQLNAMRMQQYNQFLGQGMQNSNTLNQGAMPLSGIGSQQQVQAPAPRKFSTAKTPSARLV